MDADGATEIKDMQRLEKALDGVTSDPSVPGVVVGSRAHLQNEAVAKVCTTVLSLITGILSCTCFFSVLSFATS